MVIRALWSSPQPTPWRAVAAQFTAYDRAVLLVRLFYACGLFLVVQSISEWSALLEVEAMAPPWPSAWISRDAVPTVIPWILGAYLVAALVAAALPAWRVARLAYFVMYVQYVSLISGFGGISHNNHTWLWISGLLVLLPNRGWSDGVRTERRHYFLTVIGVCQLFALFFYTLTGFWKVVFALHGAVTDRASTLGLDGFGTIIAQQQTRFNQDPVLADFLIGTPVLAWAVFVGTIYVETAAVIVTFRPRLHRAWGILLISFHVGTELAMGFTFLPNILVAAIFFVASPFAPDRTAVRDALLDLPGIHLVRRRQVRHQRSRPGRSPDPAIEAPTR